MASVKSLGLHQPSGLQHAVQEELIPANAPASSYTWDITSHHHGPDPVEDELLTTSDTVIWCRGRSFRKAFRFSLEKEPVTQALLAFFPSSEDDRAPPIAASDTCSLHDRLDKALVVFLKTQAHIYFLSGTSHVVHMPFEVESACAGPVGVLIQRRARADNQAPLVLRFPRVPPSSFVSSQLSHFESSQQTTFSVESLGNPKALRLGLGSTLENMWDTPLEQPESQWPRLLSLTDPLSDLGLVVADPSPRNHRPPRKSASKKPTFLDPAEEILHIEELHLPTASRPLQDPLILTVTLNRENSSYTIWRMTYLRREDPFIRRRSNSKQKAAWRRTSMPPAFASGTSTPVQPSFRDSFGAPLPKKRQRKSDKAEKPLDLVSSLEHQDTHESGVTRRTSRRLSSMLARADLSASHERAVFAEQALNLHNASSRRHDSHSHHPARSSSGLHHQLHPSLGSLLEAPLNPSLDEGLGNMGLEDDEFDGLQHEVCFTPIHTISLESSTLRYSTSSQPARSHCKVFILAGPPFAADDQQRTQLLVGIQDQLEQRLQLITLHVKLQEKFGQLTASVVPREQWKVQNVADSSKLTDGDMSAILVLSESANGQHELSAQSPWMELTKITLPRLLADDTRNLQFAGRLRKRAAKLEVPKAIDLADISVTGIRYPRQGGIVDIVDAHGRLHQVRIQLQPSCPQVHRALEACRSVLPEPLGGRFHSGWLHVMQWLQTQEDSAAGMEWSAFTILLLASFLCLDRPEPVPLPTARLPVRNRRQASGSFATIPDMENWKVLEMGEATNALGYPAWMLNQGWQWMLDEDALDAFASRSNDPGSVPKFLPRHIALAKDYLNSPLGEIAMGSSGYMPTALGKDPEERGKAAIDIFMALHLLLEEQKLDITTPESVSPGRADLRVLLCQISRWLKWPSFTSIYELGIQEELDSRHDSGDIRLPHPPSSSLRYNGTLENRNRITLC